MAEPIAHAIDAIKAALNQRLSFDAATERRNFVIGMADVGEMYFWVFA